MSISMIWIKALFPSEGKGHDDDDDDDDDDVMNLLDFLLRAILYKHAFLFIK